MEQWYKDRFEAAVEYANLEYPQAVAGSAYVDRGKYGHPRPGA